MTSSASELRRALEAFRRSQGLSYLQRLGGAPVERVAARAWLTSQQALETLAEALESGEIAPAEHAALAAHMARAAVEQEYEPARLASAGWAERAVSFEGETRGLGTLLGEWSRSHAPATRDRIAAAVDAQLLELTRVLLAARARADAAGAALLARVAAPRHPDAGPETGNAALAERWLALTDELTHEALAHARRLLRVEAKGALHALWATLGTDLAGLFPAEGRLRRLAADWEPLGLRSLLRAHARAATAHPGPWPAAHVVVLAAPRDIRLSPSGFELGLASELATAESVGRALGHAHASSATPLALRHASVGSVARAIGALGLLRFTDPVFLRRSRGLTARESQDVARLSAAFALVDSRLSAAAALARGFRIDATTANPAGFEQLADFASRALQQPVPPGWGAALVTRLSPGGPLRAKAHAPALAWALREHFDEDWFYNPRAAEPLRGALARAGDFSVEAFAAELGAALERGPARLAELF